MLPTGDMPLNLTLVQRLMDGVVVLSAIGRHLWGIVAYPFLMNIQGRDHLGVLDDVQGRHPHGGDDTEQAI